MPRGLRNKTGLFCYFKNIFFYLKGFPMFIKRDSMAEYSVGITCSVGITWEVRLLTANR